MSAWALGSVAYSSGYANYANPYYVSSPGAYNYAQPIQVVTQPAQVVVVQDVTQSALQVNPTGAAPQPPQDIQASTSHVDAAQSAFRSGDYATSGSEIDLAIQSLPNDAALHEFRALVQFAVGDYSKAAGTLYAVLSAGPGWDWTTMSSLYPSVDIYTTQLRALEQRVKESPDSADARFVLAYHYITGTHKDAAIKQLQEVVRLLPTDQLSAQLIKGLGGTVPVPAGTPPNPTSELSQAGDQQAPPPDIDPTKIVGRRTAKRPDGTTFTLDLTADSKFTWGYDRAGKHEEFSGTYSVDGAVLVLERSDKSTMPGLVTMNEAGFNFTLFGAPNDDPGLDFKS